MACFKTNPPIEELRTSDRNEDGYVNRRKRRLSSIVMKLLAAVSLSSFVISMGLVWSPDSWAGSPQLQKRPGFERGVVQVGDEAPNFTLRDLAGNVVSLSQLRGKGVPDLNGYGRGDEIVRLVVETPKKLSAQQRKLLEEFARISGEEVHPLSKSFLEKVKALLAS